MAQSVTDALAEFLGPIMASYCRIIEEGPGDMPVTIMFGGYKFETTLDAFKKLDKAHQAAFDRNLKTNATRHAKKAAGSLL